MSKKKIGRPISNTTTRLLLGLRHYDFQQKLLYKAKQLGRNVILCKEHYTSKCCGVCGKLNNKLGGKKIFHYSNCNTTMDRDIHAARNILLRAWTIYLNYEEPSDTVQSVKKT
jgi:transposase